MLRLSGGGWAATLLPERGAAFAALMLDGADVLAPLPEGADPNATPAGAFLMLPWANRLDGGRLPLPGGGEHRLPLTRPDEGNAIHGLARERAWTVAAASPSRARLALRLGDAPYDLDAAMEVSLGPEGVRVAVSLANRADAPSPPVGHGWHPWFVRGPRARVAFAATHALETDARNLPVRAAPHAGLADADPVGHDTHFAGWGGTVALDLDAAPLPRLALRGEGAWSRNLQLYAPPGRPVLCAEPQSHATDAANRAWLDAHGPMAVLAPGAALAGAAVLSRA